MIKQFFYVRFLSKIESELWDVEEGFRQLWWLR